ncbi:hypothetical protein ACFX2A_025298 [Malus domestica]
MRRATGDAASVDVAVVVVAAAAAVAEEEDAAASVGTAVVAAAAAADGGTVEVHMILARGRGGVTVGRHAWNHIPASSSSAAAGIRMHHLLSAVQIHRFPEVEN